MLRTVVGPGGHFEKLLDPSRAFGFSKCVARRSSPARFSLEHPLEFRLLRTSLSPSGNRPRLRLAARHWHVWRNCPDERLSSGSNRREVRGHRFFCFFLFFPCYSLVLFSPALRGLLCYLPNIRNSLPPSGARTPCRQRRVKSHAGGSVNAS